MANIDKLIAQQKELAERIEQETEKVYLDFGKEFINELEIPFEKLGTKKEIKEVVTKLKSQINLDEFQNTSENSVDSEEDLSNNNQNIYAENEQKNINDSNNNF